MVDSVVVEVASVLLDLPLHGASLMDRDLTGWTDTKSKLAVDQETSPELAKTFWTLIYDCISTNFCGSYLS